MVAALVIGAVSAVAAERVDAAPSQPPSAITLTSNRTLLTAGQSATLTATTDVAVGPSASTIAILDQSTGSTVASCDTGRKCVASVSFVTGGPHTYVAVVGSLTSEAVVVEREAWTVDLASDSAAVGAGATTRLIATTNQNLTKTAFAYQTYIFDLTLGTVLGSCSTGNTCAIRTPAFDGGGTHDYLAYVAAAGSPSAEADLLDIQAQSEVASVAAVDWVVTLDVASHANFEVAVGAKTRLTATTNQNVGNTSGEYSTYIFDVTDNVIVGSCVTGKVCNVTTPAFKGYAHEYVAVVAASGEPASLAEATDIRGQSQTLFVDSAWWSISLYSDRSELRYGASANLTASTNHNVGKTGGTYVIAIFDRTTGEVVKTCSTGKSCSVKQTFTSGPEHEYTAAVVRPSAATTVEDAVDVRAQSSVVTVSRARWELVATISTNELPANAVAKLTSVSDQSLSRTNGAYATYWFNAISGDRLGACTTGKSCRATVFDTDSSAPHMYVAYVAAATDPATVDQLVDVVGSSNVVIADDEYELSLSTEYEEIAPGSLNYLTATPNFDLDSVVSGETEIGIVFVDATTDTVVGECDTAGPEYGCSVEFAFAGVGEHVYRAYIADLSGATSLSSLVDVRALSNDVVVTGRDWSLSLDIDRSVVLVNDPVTMTVSISPQLPMAAPHYVYLVDTQTGSR